MIEWQEKEKREQASRASAGEEHLTESEEQMVSDTWKRMNVDSRAEDIGNENSCERPGKRRKLRERIKDVDVMWGQTQIVESEESNGILKWLYEVPEEPVSDASKKETMKQKKLEPWTWVRIAAWDTLIEIARNIEKDKVKEEQEAEKQVARIGEEFKERKTLIGEERLGKTAEEVSSSQTAAKKPSQKKKKTSGPQEIYQPGYQEHDLEKQGSS